MLLDLVIAACAALAFLGIARLPFALLRRRPPRWLGPVAAGLGVIVVTAALRYQWAGRTEALLPPEMRVVERLKTSTPFEPWSYAVPITTALVVADGGSARRNPAHPSLVMLDVLLIRRDADTLVARHLVDCGLRRDGVVPAGASLAGDTLPAGIVWAETSPPALVSAACAAGG